VKTFVLIGHPVSHSMSPAMHHAAYAALGLPHRYEVVDCPDEAAVRRELERLRSGEVSGVNVTVPHKRLALALADEAVPDARRLGAANVWVRGADGKVVAHNTDVPALCEEVLRYSAGAPASATVIGSGGAALASVAACFQAGAREVWVSARAFSAQVPRQDWSRAAEFEKLGAKPVAWPASGHAPGPFVDAARESDVLIQATTAGMLHADPGESVSDLVPWGMLRPTALAYDLVYNPPRTSFLRSAEAAKIRAQGGLGMLVGQAGLSIKLWLGLDPPHDTMRKAAEERLSRGS
jgi:shikimate dehydrogenase